MRHQVIICCFFLLITFKFSFEVSAQLCQGSLGDPVVNITFGSGTGQGRPQGNSTNYTYLNGNCPDDGFYTIANSVNNCFGGSWHNLQEDHTPGDVNGYMMVVNASFTPGDFFVKTVDGLCPNTTYEFAAWIFNVLEPFACRGQGIKPNITFNIETTSGEVLQSYQTGDIQPFPDWKQYGFFFSTTTGISSVVLRMINNAPGGCGNDLLLDDITFRACGPLVRASIVGKPDSVDLCVGDKSVFTLHANVSAGYTDPVYQWQSTTNNGASWNNIPGATDTIYVRPAIISPGRYFYRLTVSQRTNMNVASCSIASNTVVISVNKFPVPAASSSGSCIGDTLSFNANDGISFAWKGPVNFNNNDQSPFIPKAAPVNSGMYYVQVTSDKGCTSIDSTLVTIYSKPIINAGADGATCEGESIQLHSIGNNITSYQWTPAAEISNPVIPDPVAVPRETTTYILTVANIDCKVSDSVTITVYKNPKADAGPDKVIIEGQATTLNGTVAGTDVTYKWSPNTFIEAQGTLTPSVNPPANQIYALQVISNKGCETAVDSVLVKVFKKVFIPNAFTPNFDGINDTWFIETLEAYPNAEVRVYNRYGQMVFDNHGVNKPWDGKFKGNLLSSGAYAYLIDLKNGSPLIKGVVFIIL